MIRKALPLLAVLSLAPLAPLAHAQLSVYGDVNVTHMTGISSSPVLQTLSPPPCTGSLTTNCTSYRDSVNPVGFTGGASFDFKHYDRFTLGADARGIVNTGHQGAQSDFDGAGTRLYGAMGGIKVGFNTPILYIHPFVEGAFGYARSNFGVLTNAQHNGSTFPATTVGTGIPTQNGLMYNVFAGTDLHALPWADWRVFELGYGAVHTGGTYGHNYPLYSISTGVVFHIPPR